MCPHPLAPQPTHPLAIAIIAPPVSPHLVHVASLIQPLLPCHCHADEVRLSLSLSLSLSWCAANSSDALHQDEPTPKITLTSFRMATTLRTGLGARQWQCLLVDESHTLCSKARAVDAQQTESVAALAHRVPHLLLLSGTPSLSRPFSIWRQVRHDRKRIQSDRCQPHDLTRSDTI